MIINSKKLNVAILDDYQNVSHEFADWGKISEKIELDVFKNYYLDQGFENPYNKNDDAIVRTGSGGDNVDGRLRLDETECPGGYGNGAMITLRAKTHKEVQLSLIKPDGWCK